MKQSHFEFYNTDKSYVSAKKILEAIMPWINGIKSFQDLGSGVGGWSKVLEEKGYTKFVLYDHPSIQRDRLLIENKDRFVPIDLENQIPRTEAFDLSICIEVFEHFHEDRALVLLDYLTDSSDLILFSAAVPFQKGNGHINEKNHSYWHTQFQKRGFQYFDGFKLEFMRQKVDKENFFHFQNIFLYFKAENCSFPTEQNLTSEFFELRATYLLEKEFTISDSLKLLLKALLKSLLHRTKLVKLKNKFIRVN